MTAADTIVPILSALVGAGGVAAVWLQTRAAERMRLAELEAEQEAGKREAARGPLERLLDRQEETTGRFMTEAGACRELLARYEERAAIQDERIDRLVAQRDEARQERDADRKRVVSLEAQLAAALGRIESLEAQVKDLIPKAFDEYARWAEEQLRKEPPSNVATIGSVRRPR